ncbi:MAG: hypothetical protein J0L92_04085 [Deltaproteobacteria bacterium]|nr:hypothetical protein [Deltaproteobacteria bacterium]
MRLGLGLSVLIATTLVACTPTHGLAPDAGSDTRVDADVVTPDEQIAIEFVQATCRALSSCPTGLQLIDFVYAHGEEQCMNELGQYLVDYLRQELRSGTLEVDTDVLTPCSEILASGNCPMAIDDFYSSFLDFRDCDWYDVFVPARRVGRNEHCGDEASCVRGLECRRTASCGSVCLEPVLEPQPCERWVDCPAFLECSPRGLCESPTRRVAGLGQACGLTRDSFERIVCEPGLYCRADRFPTHCATIPRAGDPCTEDGLCAPGTFCVEGLCRAGPRREGESCDRGYFETDPCDRPNGLVCARDRCARVGRALGDPCIETCDDGLACNGTCEDGVCSTACGPPRTWPEPLPDGSPCTPSDLCASHWCQPESGLCGAPTPPCE